MSRSHYIQPFLCSTFSIAHQSPDPVNQDFSTCSGKGIHTGCFEGRQHFMVGHFFQLGNMCHFGWPECVQPDFWKFSLDGAERIGIVFESEVWMVAALQEPTVSASG